MFPAVKKLRWRFAKVTMATCISRLQRFLFNLTYPGALPQALAFRALGAELNLTIQTLILPDKVVDYSETSVRCASRGSFSSTNSALTSPNRGLRRLTIA